MIQAIEQEEVEAAAKTAEVDRYAGMSDRHLARTGGIYTEDKIQARQ
jgi:hypothetical protein